MPTGALRSKMSASWWSPLDSRLGVVDVVPLHRVFLLACDRRAPWSSRCAPNPGGPVARLRFSSLTRGRLRLLELLHHLLEVVARGVLHRRELPVGLEF